MCLAVGIMRAELMATCKGNCPNMNDPSILGLTCCIHEKEEKEEINISLFYFFLSFLLPPKI